VRGHRFNPIRGGSCLLLAAFLSACSSSTPAAPTTITPATFTITWNSTAFPATGVGLVSSATLIVTLWNTGSTVVPVASIGNSNADEFPIASACQAGGSLAANSNCTFTVRFKPATTGDRTSTLTINANSTTQTLSLTGTGVALAPQLTITAAGDVAPNVFSAAGTGGTPAGSAELHTVSVPSPANPQIVSLTTTWPLDAAGSFTATVTIEQPGSYEHWFVDLTSGLSSNHVRHTVP
jgi:hypothetical protein